MKKHIFFSSLYMLLIATACAQTSDYRVVFDLTSRDTINQQAVIREIGLIRGPTRKLSWRW